MPITPDDSRSFKSVHSNPVLVYKDVWAVFDDGSYAVQDYSALAKQLEEQARGFRDGVGCLVIIPSGARRIQDDVRSELDRMLAGIHVRCLCWAVLETGFRGATIRAILSAMSVLGPKRGYPMHITGSINEAVTWLVPRLSRGAERHREIAEATRLFEQRLAEFETSSRS